MNRKYIIRTVKENVPDIICEGVLILRGIQYYDGSFYVVDKGEQQVLKYSSNGEKTSLRCLNDPYGIYVHQKYVLVCDSKNHCVRVLNEELTLWFSIPDIQEPMDITYFKGLYFVTSRYSSTGAIVILDIDLPSKTYTLKLLITEVDSISFCSHIRGICANNEYLYVAERGYPLEVGGRILCLEYDPSGCKLKYVSEFTTQDNTHLPLDIVCDSDNTVYYSARDEGNTNFFVAKLIHHPKGTMSGYEVFYP